MDNGDLPAFPVFNESGKVTDRLNSIQGNGMGLSKREYFAIEILKAIISSDGAPMISMDEETNMALKYADNLLEKL